VLDLVRRIVPSAVSVLPRTGGQQNTVYEVHRPEPEPPLIVKVYASESRWRQAKEVHVYRMLADHGVGPAPRILDVRTDRLTLMTLLPGRMLSEVDDVDTRRIYRQLGGIMAEMHSITQDAYGYLTTRILDPEPTNSAYMTRQFAAKLDEFASLGGEPALHAAMEARVASAAHLFVNCARPVLCHNDLHEGNILVAPCPDGWDITGFVDVENAIAADPLMDLAKTGYYAIRDDDTKLAGLLAGYGRLPADGMDRLAIYRLYHALELWDWFASIGNTAPLPGILEDIRREVSQPAAGRRTGCCTAPHTGHRTSAAPGASPAPRPGQPPRRE
jgi:hygromycin-B 7''-O-kinase